eukprot:125856_1
MCSTIKYKIINELMEMGYHKQQIRNGFDSFNTRLLWDVNSACLIYSRKNKNWCDGQIIDVIINEKTNQEWLKVKYNKNSTKQIQRFNDHIIPNDHQHYNHKIVKFISNTLKLFKTTNLDKEIKLSTT